MFIYKIKNLLNEKFYIGKTKKNPNERFKEHFYLSKKSKTHFHKAIKKYGFQNFQVEILEVVDCNDLLNEKEKYWIEKLKPSYNKTLGGDGVVGYTYTEEHKQNMSLSKKGRKNSQTHNLNISLSKKGKKQSTEHIQKRILSRTVKNHTENSKQKISEAHKNKPKLKNVCRLCDRKLMNVANFVFWSKLQKN